MFVHMSVHFPRPGKEPLIVESMRRFGAAMQGKPGHIQAHALKDEKTGRLIGLALWESREQWEAAMPDVHKVVEGDDFEAWEERPPEVFHLGEAALVCDVEALLPLDGPFSGKDTFDQLWLKVLGIVCACGTPEEKLGYVVKVLEMNVPHYNWVGFYLTDPDERDVLVLGPYEGAPTDHTRIPFGRGICGQAAQAKETFVVPDVTAEDNYLSCSVNVKSEIVVPILRDGEVLGELDVDSQTGDAFTDDDRAFLEKVAELVRMVL
jgi:GAF domain-containing protein